MSDSTAETVSPASWPKSSISASRWLQTLRFCSTKKSLARLRSLSTMSSFARSFSRSSTSLLECADVEEEELQEALEPRAMHVRHVFHVSLSLTHSLLHSFAIILPLPGARIRIGCEGNLSGVCPCATARGQHSSINRYWPQVKDSLLRCQSDSMLVRPPPLCLGLSSRPQDPRQGK